MTHFALFGSRSRGDFRSDSDVDILLDVAPQSRFNMLDLVGVERLVSNATGLVANAFMRSGLESGYNIEIASDIVDIF